MAGRSGWSGSRPRPVSMVNGGSSVPEWLNRPPLLEQLRTNSQASNSSSNSGAETGLNPIPGEEITVASGNGVTLSIALAEPVLFLQGLDQSEVGNQSTSMLRGNFHLRVSKAAKIKAISLSFKGRAETEWPEGIPPKKTEFRDRDSIINHIWPFFNAQFQAAEHGSGADFVQPLKGPSATTREIGVTDAAPEHRKRSTFGLSNKDQKRMSMQVNPTRSQKDEASNSGPTVAQKGYRTFPPGDYVYNFELPLDSRLPESVAVDLGNVRYELEAVVERAGAFRANLIGTREVVLIRAPSEGSLEQVEPIAISRNWEDQLHYDIVISGKSFPLGSQVPIAFKLTPLAKVQCHKIKVFVTENIQYFTSNKRVHRLEPTRRILLFEKRADSKSTSTFPGSEIRITAGGGVAYDSRAAAARGEEDVPRDATNLLGNLDTGGEVGPTEMEFNVQLPTCPQMKERDRAQQLHFDTTYAGIQVHHWIKIVMRLSKPDAVDKAKRRHFEISIDSPFQILSCQATQANIALPAYTSPESATLLTDHPACGCPGAARRQNTPPTIQPSIRNLRIDTGQNRSSASISSPPTAGLARPPTAHVHTTTTNMNINSLSLNSVIDDADRDRNASHRTRPIHLVRQPSFLPPPFSASADDPPPPLMTPPPNYDTLVTGDMNGLADYFQRLANEVGEEEDSRGTMSPGARMEVPLTPGGRLNRSMDERRTWLPLEAQ